MMRSRDRQRGVAAVEFALIAPFFMLVLFATFELGITFYKQQVINSTVREAGRMGRLATEPRPSASEIEEYAREYMDSVGLDPAAATIVVSGAGGGTGDSLAVEIEYETSLALLSTFLAEEGASVPQAVMLSARSVVDLE